VIDSAEMRRQGEGEGEGATAPVSRVSPLGYRAPMKRGLSLVLATLLVLAACNSDPPMDTPEGVAIAALRAARANDADAFLAIAQNPNQPVIDESGGGAPRGSYASVLLEEGRTALRGELEAAAHGPLPTGSLNVWSSPFSGGAWDVTISGTTGSIHVMVVSTAHGLRAAHIGGAQP
jgi:hypothetical protein